MDRLDCVNDTTPIIEQIFLKLGLQSFGTGWRRLIGCFTLEVIFCKRATNYRALLQKMTYGDKAFCVPVPPCRVYLVTSGLVRYVTPVSLAMAWRWHLYGVPRLIGSPKLQIIFHKRATKYRSLLQKMTYKDKGSYESSPPCNKANKSFISHKVNISFHKIWFGM